MREGVLSEGLWRVGRTSKVAETPPIVSGERALRPREGWDAEKFACDQIRGLVRQIFAPSVTAPVRQVVFSAVEIDTDIRAICLRVGETLATQTMKDVAIVTNDPCMRREEKLELTIPAREIATKIRRNLWSVPFQRNGEDGTSAESLHSYLGEIRREFEYSIVATSWADGPQEAIAMGQVADGVILVLSALHTKRAVARKLRDALSQSRFLGTVLSDREFPIPDRIYRRL